MVDEGDAKRRAGLDSALYNYVRSRQLEGTFPGAPETGTWVVTGMRIHKGWGAPPEEAWPYDGYRWPPGPEPTEIDQVAKARRWFSYGRARDLTEFKQLLAAEKPIIAAFEIDDSWRESRNGRIDDPRSHKPSGAHTIRIVGYNDADSMLTFANSWGVKWGDEGYGYLPYAYLDQRLLEAWYQDLGRPAREENSSGDAGKMMLVTGVLNILGRVLHVVEQVDLAADEIMGWAQAVEINNVLQVDELFVRPAYRGRGLGHRLAAEVAAISTRQAQQLRLWISHADWAGAATPAQTATIASLGLTVMPCPERWASRVAM
jgi:GNAT superfamily N-acetyltransferase